MFPQGAYFKQTVQLTESRCPLAQQVDPALAATFDSQSFPLSSPFLGESGNYQVYKIGDATGTYTVSYTPLVRGNYSITVKKPAAWEVQLVQTEREDSGADLSGMSSRPHE